MTVKELILALLDYDPKADVFFDLPDIIYPIDFVEGHNSIRVILKYDNTKKAL